MYVDNAMVAVLGLMGLVSLLNWGFILIATKTTTTTTQSLDEIPVASTVPLFATCSICIEECTTHLICSTSANTNNPPLFCTICFDRHLVTEIEAVINNERETQHTEQEQEHHGLHIHCLNPDCFDSRCTLIQPQTIALFTNDTLLYDRYLQVVGIMAVRKSGMVNISHLGKVTMISKSNYPKWYVQNLFGCKFSGLEVFLPRVGDWQDSLVTPINTALEETKEETKDNTSAINSTNNTIQRNQHRCSIFVCSRRIRTFKWLEHHCRSCGRAVCSPCSLFTILDGYDVEYNKRKPKRVCNECIETFIERLEPDNVDIDAVSVLEEHLLRWEERRLVPHAQHYVDKLQAETELSYTKKNYHVRKCLSSLQLVKRRLARETQQAIATSSSRIEDQRIRDKLEADLDAAQVNLSNLIEEATNNYRLDVLNFERRSQTRPRNNINVPVTLSADRKINREARVEARQTERWTTISPLLMNQWTNFCMNVENQSNVFVQQMQVSFDFSVAANARRIAEERIIQIAEDERMVRETYANARGCPRCKFFISRTVGCDRIVCQCGHIFCYKCGMTSMKSHTCCWPRSHN